MYEVRTFRTCREDQTNGGHDEIEKLTLFGPLKQNVKNK